MSAYVKSYYPAGTPVFEPMSPVFEDRTHPASLTPCGIHNPALLELIRTDVSREMVCKWLSVCGIETVADPQTTSPTVHLQSLHALPPSPRPLHHPLHPSRATFPKPRPHHPVYHPSRHSSLSFANSPTFKSRPSSRPWYTSNDYDTGYPK